MANVETKAKKKYNKTHYSRVTVALPKNLVFEFKEKKKKKEISQASVIKHLIENYTKEPD